MKVKQGEVESKTGEVEEGCCFISSCTVVDGEHCTVDKIALNNLHNLQNLKNLQNMPNLHNMQNVPNLHNLQLICACFHVGAILTGFTGM